MAGGRINAKMGEESKVDHSDFRKALCGPFQTHLPTGTMDTIPSREKTVGRIAQGWGSELHVTGDSEEGSSALLAFNGGRLEPGANSCFNFSQGKQYLHILGAQAITIERRVIMKNPLLWSQLSPCHTWSQ